MQYRRLGRTELMVAEVGAGTGSLPSEGEVAAETLRAAIDAGCTLIEFAIDDAGATAAIIEVVQRQRLHVLLVATGNGDITQLEAALEQLGNPSIELYLVDAGNVAALSALRESEFTRFAGVAATDAAEALAAIEGGEADIMQWPYHLGGPDAEAVFAAAATADVGLIGCSPLAGGQLLRGAAAGAVTSLIAGAPRTPAQAAIAWALSEPRLAAVVVASRTAAQATENAEGSDVAPLPEPELERVAGLLG
ncbi:MAG TPA: aldo/keto reductase [Dehalococcoidia bacterium]|jgi:aryl-alcohol dehydrogenase-like predicted oxidoreductase|nr:aldo/keto reductase [Dehalococcoidia bacterium]